MSGPIVYLYSIHTPQHLLLSHKVMWQPVFVIYDLQYVVCGQQQLRPPTLLGTFMFAQNCPADMYVDLEQRLCVTPGHFSLFSAHFTTCLQNIISQIFHIYHVYGFSYMCRGDNMAIMCLLTLQHPTSLCRILHNLPDLIISLHNFTSRLIL